MYGTKYPGQKSFSKEENQTKDRSTLLYESMSKFFSRDCLFLQNSYSEKGSSIDRTKDTLENSNIESFHVEYENSRVTLSCLNQSAMCEYRINECNELWQNSSQNYQLFKSSYFESASLRQQSKYQRIKHGSSALILSAQQQISQECKQKQHSKYKTQNSVPEMTSLMLTSDGENSALNKFNESEIRRSFMRTPRWKALNYQDHIKDQHKVQYIKSTISQIRLEQPKQFSFLIELYQAEYLIFCNFKRKIENHIFNLGQRQMSLSQSLSQSFLVKEDLQQIFVNQIRQTKINQEQKTHLSMNLEKTIPKKTTNKKIYYELSLSYKCFEMKNFVKHTWFNVKILKLNYCLIRDEEWFLLVDNFSIFQILQQLQLDGNMLHCPKAQDLYRLKLVCPMFKKISLMKNHITHSSYLELIDFQKVSRIKVLLQVVSLNRTSSASNNTTIKINSNGDKFETSYWLKSLCEQQSDTWPERFQESQQKPQQSEYSQNSDETNNLTSQTIQIRSESLVSILKRRHSKIEFIDLSIEQIELAEEHQSGKNCQKLPPDCSLQLILDCLRKLDMEDDT